jgi:hypothetical protein
MPGFDLKQINRNDQIIMGAGALTLILSFFPGWYTVSVSSGLFKVSKSYNAWQGIGILGILLLIAAAGIVAARVLGGVQLPTMPLGWNVIVAGAAALGTVLMILEWLIMDPTNGFSGHGVSQGLGWAGYVLLLIALAETFFAYKNMQASGEKMSWDATAMNKAPAAGSTPPAPYPPQDAAPTYPPATEPPASYPPSGPADPGAPGV